MSGTLAKAQTGVNTWLKIYTVPVGTICTINFRVINHSDLDKTTYVDIASSMDPNPANIQISDHLEIDLKLDTNDVYQDNGVIFSGGESIFIRSSDVSCVARLSGFIDVLTTPSPAPGPSSTPSPTPAPTPGPTPAPI